MDQYWRGRSPAVLWTFMLFAIGYAWLMYTYSPLTGEIRLDGAIAVVLGLYLCSHPASNVLDLLFEEGGARRSPDADRRTIPWYFLNLMLLIVGWFVVWTGLTCFTTESGIRSVPGTTPSYEDETDGSAPALTGWSGITRRRG
jgi:hypothetical protein